MARADWVAALSLLLVVSACSGSEGDEVEQPTPGPNGSGAVPRFVVGNGTRELVLDAWTYCIPGVCADGGPSSDPPSIGSSETVRISVTMTEPRLTATLRNPGSACQRRYAAVVSQVGPTEWQLGPSGPAGAYDVDLFVEGKGGSAAATFRWTASRGGTAAAQACDT